LSKPYPREALARRLRHVIANAQQDRLAVDAERTSRPSAEPVPATGRAVSILLVEDNALIRADTAIMLEEMGHTVVQAGKAAPALAHLEGQAFDLLLTDLGLPDMNGNDLAQRAVGLQPGLAVVYATGDSHLPAGCPQQAVLLCKPYGEDDLRGAVEEALARIA
jgi:CheY-like chemotaxis protein